MLQLAIMCSLTEMGKVENVNKELEVITMKTNENSTTEKYNNQKTLLKSRVEITKHRIMNLEEINTMYQIYREK